MNREQAYATVRETFTKSFDRKRFHSFAFNLLNHVDESKAESRNSQYIKEAFKSHVRRYERLGTYTSPNKQKLDVLIIHVTDQSKLERARTAIRNFVADHLKLRDEKDAALVAFVSPDEKSWRLSYVKMEYEALRENDGKISVQTRLTPARRFSYLVGEGESCHTAQTRFLNLLQDTNKDPLLSDIEEAFSVEAVTKEFFIKYVELFESINKELEKLIKKEKVVREEFERKHVSTIEFAKKLMGQIVFLYFLQKKGWLGVAKGKDWGTGPHDFLRRLANSEYGEYSNFFNEVLEPLFYDTLATDRGHEAWCNRFKCRIPFLNGGLFEPIADYNWRRHDIKLSNKLFHNREFVEEGIYGTGILDVFDRYNFTVNEAEPLEKEVAIDPEMLGKVFENLIEENRRKGLGAYYTPREIVHYMCQEVLINYIWNSINTVNQSVSPQKPKQAALFKVNGTEQALTTISMHSEIIPRKEIETFIHIGEQISHYEAVDTKYSVTMPKRIQQYARQIDDLLSVIRICDPAVGSGAFAVGLMTEIVRARSSLTPYFNDVHERAPYFFKRHAIQNCLYGVDIDDTAVEIAKLRLWLSLVVDEDETKQIKPLPNLDYKIVSANSLLGFSFKSQRLQQIEKLKLRFFDEPDHAIKADLKNEIDFLLKECFDMSKESLGYEVNFDFQIHFSEVFNEKGGFDVLIANPPYVGQSGNKDIFREVLRTSFGKRYHQRRMDYFYFFFHKAIELAKPGGLICYVSTNYFLTATYADKLRRHLREATSIVRIMNFENVKLFESAQGQHNAITILIKEPSATEFAEVGVTARHGLIDSSTLLSILGGTDDQTSYAVLNKNEIYDGSRNYIRIPAEGEHSKHLINEILSKIKDRYALLLDFADIFQGIVTGANQVTEAQIERYGLTAQPGEGIFVLTNDEVQALKLNEFESSLLRPWFKNSDISRWVESRESRKKLIYIRADADLPVHRIPNLRKHFKRFKPLLINRNIRTGSITVKEYEEFVEGKRDVPYVMIKSAFKSGKYFCISYARSESVFLGEKIVCPQFSPLNTFGFHNGKWFAASDVYFIKKRRDRDLSLKYLLGLLNSKLYYFWLYHKGQRKGSSLQLFRDPLSEIPIMKPNPTVENTVAGLVDTILALKADTNSGKINRLEREIDLVVYKLYELSEEEIAVVENAFQSAHAGK